MKVALIGVGQAGGKVTERLARFDAEMGFGAVQDALAVNSAKADLAGLEVVDTALIGTDRVNGHGVGADNELGTEIMQSDSAQVLDALDGRITSSAEAIFVVAGLGGGTGSGGAPVLVHRLQRVYDVPADALGILPGRDEGSLYQANAGRSLKTLLREADATLLVDNDAWHEQGESVEGAFETINRRIARRVGLLFASGEAVDGVGESVVDSSEVINTLRSGGVATLGYASEAAAEDSAENINTVLTVSRQALLTGTSMPDATTADAALLVIAGKPDAVPGKASRRRGGGSRTRPAACRSAAGTSRSRATDSPRSSCSAAPSAPSGSRRSWNAPARRRRTTNPGTIPPNSSPTTGSRTCFDRLERRSSRTARAVTERGGAVIRSSISAGDPFAT